MRFLVSLSLHNLLGSEVCVKSKPPVLFGGIEAGLKNQRPDLTKEESECVVVLQIRLKSYPWSSWEKDLRAQKNNNLKGISYFHQCESKYLKSRWKIPVCLKTIVWVNVVFPIHLLLCKESLFSTNYLLLFQTSVTTPQIHISCLLGNMGHVASVQSYLYLPICKKVPGSASCLLTDCCLHCVD